MELQERVERQLGGLIIQLQVKDMEIEKLIKRNAELEAAKEAEKKDAA